MRRLLIALLLLFPLVASAQQAQASFWILKGGALKPVNNAYGLWMPGLATSTTGCLSVNSDGWVSATGSTCGGSAGGGGGVATTSLLATTPIIITKTSASITFTWSGLATTSQPSSSNLLTSNGGAGVYGVATSTLTPTSPLTGSFVQIGSAGTLGIQNASASQGGAITLNDYQRLYAATTTFSGALTYSGATNAVTCNTASGTIFGCLSTNDWTTFNNKLGTSTLLTIGQVVYVGANNGLTSVATGTVSAGSTQITVTAGRSVIGGALSIDCATASAAQAGCITAASFSKFNSATTTFASPMIFTGSTNQVTWSGIATSSGATGGQFAAWNSATGLYSIASSSLVANPTASVALSAVNGSATTFMRSDAAPALDQTISPTMTGNWAFTPTLASTTFSRGLNATQIASLFFQATSTTQASQFPLATSTAVTATTICFPTDCRQAWPTASVTGGTQGMMTAWASATTLTATGTPTGGSFFATSSVSTSTFMGPIQIGRAANNGYILGTTTRFQMSDSLNSYLQSVCWNTNSGGNASCEMVFNNNLSTDSTYFGSMGINGGGYNNTLFSGDRPNDLFFVSSDGGMDFSLASTSASNASSSFRFLTKGTQSSNIRFEIFANGKLAAGTSTPSLGVFSIASSSGPQISLLDGTNFGWSERSVGGSYYLATSTMAATSTTAAFSIANISGNVTIPNVLSAGSLTLGNALTAANGGTGATSLSSAFTVSSNVFSNIVERSFSIPATTTSGTWTGTSTTPLLQATVASTLVGYRCRVYPLNNNLFLNVQIGKGSASTTMVNASTTNNFITPASAFTLAAGDSLSVVVGTTSLTAVFEYINCTTQLRI